jgi:hypothetical protein
MLIRSPLPARLSSALATRSPLLAQATATALAEHGLAADPQHVRQHVRIGDDDHVGRAVDWSRARQ